MNNPEIKNKKPLVEDFTQVDYNTKVLEVKNLKKHFFIGTGKKKLAVPAVDDVTFDVYKREVFGLVGESGCGKTTTGRTIIKLYNATEGSVVLNDIKISGGYLNHINAIAEIKRQLKVDIEELDPAKRQINQINAKTEIKVQSLEAEIQAIKAEHQAKLKEAKKSLEKYQDDVYELNNKFKLAVANEEYNANLAINDITMQTKNKAEIELINESKIAKKTYENKVDGMNDSAALNQDVIKSRLEDLKVEYEAKLAELEKTYRPLIENEAKNILPKDKAKKQIAKINADKKAKITAIKEKYAADKLNVTKPNKSFVSAKTKEINEAYNKIYANLKNEINSVKAQAKTEIASLPKSSVQTDEYKAKKAELTQIANEKIKEHKAAIEEVKNVNSSKDTLQASQKMQMIFQDPISSLNPRMTVKEIIAEGLVIQKKYTMEEINERVAEVLQLVGLAPEYATRYPHEFSGGQRQRIGIARALIMNPNFIIADEPISALDVSIRAQVINLLTNLKEQLGLTVLFIAHDLSVVRFFCDRIAVMYAGKIVELAPAEELFRNPQHPYTKSLLSAIPQPDPDYEKGRSRIHYNPAQHNYKTDKPSMQEVAPGHLVYANKAEFELYKLNYGKKSNDKTPGNTK